MKFELVTDSTCTLTADLIEKLDLHILPMSLFINEEVHYSNLYEQPEELKSYYDMLREGTVVTTSLPNLADTRNTFEALLKEGKDVLYLAFSTALSSCFDTINLLCKELQEQYPERTIRAVETLAACGGEGLLVYLAAKKRMEGASLEEVEQYVMDNRLHIAHWFTVDDLMYLMRGGRVSKTSAYVGTMLKVKPILHVDNEGKLIPVDKVRGRKKAIKALVDHVKETADRKSVV